MRKRERSFPVGVCVKVKHLRPKYQNLKEWLETESHVLVCRSGRIFINKEIFHYKQHEFANPFPVKEHGLD